MIGSLSLIAAELLYLAKVTFKANQFSFCYEIRKFFVISFMEHDFQKKVVDITGLSRKGLESGEWIQGI